MITLVTLTILSFFLSGLPTISNTIMEASIKRTNTSVTLVIKLKHIGLLLCQVSDFLLGKKQLQEHGLKGVKCDTQIGTIFRMSKGKAIPETDLVLG